MTSTIETTSKAVLAALDSPLLAKPGKCAYVDGAGHYCIVGAVLHNLGVSDETMTAENTVGILEHGPLRDVAFNLGLDLRLLEAVQEAFDNGGEVRDIDEVREQIIMALDDHGGIKR